MIGVTWDIGGFRLEVGQDLLGRWHWTVTRPGSGLPLAGGTAWTRKRAARHARQAVRQLQKGAS